MAPDRNVPHKTVRVFREGSLICLQGEPADCLYVLRAGRVGVVVNLGRENPDLPTINRHGVTVAEISEEGSIVGEAGLFLRRRTASLRSLTKVTQVEIIPLGNGGVQRLVEARPETGLTLCRSLAGRLRNLSAHIRAANEAIMATHNTYNSLCLSFLRLVQSIAHGGMGSQLQVVLERLREHPVYRDAETRQHHQSETVTAFNVALAKKRAGTIDVPAGTELCREGDVGRCLYLIQNGGLEVRIAGKRVTVVEAGELVGEIAVLLKEHPVRTASMKALVDTRLATISAADFAQLAATRPTILVNLAHTMSKRVEATNRMACDINLGIRTELDRLAASPHSCEHAFRQLAKALSGHGEELATALRTAEDGASRAVKARQEMQETFDTFCRGES